MIRSALTVLVVALAVSCTGPKGETGMKGEAGPPGPQGDTGPGFMTPPSVSSVVPNRVAASLTVDVSISGFATSWMNGAQVSFGNGVTVNSVKAGSRTGLVANITVAPDAMPGTRDVRVTQGNEVTTFAGVFTIVPLFDVKPIGTASRGGYWYFEVRSNDPSVTFPDTRDAVSATVAPAPMMGAVFAEVSVLKPGYMAVRVHADFQATMQPYTVTLSWGGRSLALPEFELADRMELQLSDTTPIMGMTMLPYESKMVKYTPAAAPVPVVLHVSGPAGARWHMVLLDANGQPLDTSGSMGAPAPGNDIVITGDVNGSYILLSEVDGRPTTQFTLSALAGIAPIAEVEPNDAKEEAQVLMLNPLGGDMGIRITGDASYGDDDWYKVTVTAADVGKRIHARSYTTDYIWFDGWIRDSSGRSLAFHSNETESITVDLYSPTLSAGDYFVHFVGDYSGAHDIVISLH